MTRLPLILIAAACLCPAQQKQERDLRFERDSGPARAAQPSPAIPRSYALVVGVANYLKLPPAQQLKFPERDAEAVYSILISPEGGNFRAENVRKLVGPKATLAGLKRELESWLAGVSKDDDRVLIYFAGHGFVHQGRAYLAPYDLDPADIARTGYPMDELGKVFGGRIRGKWKVLLTDSCHSGAIRPDDDVRAINKALIDLDRSVLSLTASRDRERSFESPQWGGGHGIFTYYVVKGMEGAADETGDGVVNANELIEYVRRNVREVTGGQQNPLEGGSFDPAMLLAYVPSRAAPGAPPPPKFGTLIFESNMDGVEVFVDGRSIGAVDKVTPLRLPGLVPGVHTVKGVRMGYEPDGPREETVYPGQETTVTIKILIPRRRNRGAADLFEKALDAYNKGSAENYRKAASQFQAALNADPAYSQAALYLGRCYRSLFDQQQAEKYIRRALEIDPDYTEARATLGGLLLDTGSLDESIRQLNAVVQRDPGHALAWYMLAQALRMKESYAQSIEAARKAIRLTPNNAEAHFWLAESLRMSGAYRESLAGYSEYLRLSDFDSKLAGKMNYYVVGFLVGMGKKKRAAERDVWRDLRSLAYFGLCDSSRKLGELDAAIRNCQRSLAYDPEDPYVHWALGLSYAGRANQTGEIALAAAARTHFRRMLDLNSEMAEAGMARKNIEAIDAALRSN